MDMLNISSLLHDHAAKHPQDVASLNNYKLDDAEDMSSELRLILEIEKYPCLYNFWLPEYSRKDVIKKAWVEIAAKTETPVHDCKEKWRNIRSSFLRSLKAPPRGSKPKKPYYLKKHLHFIIPFVKPMKNTTAPNARPPESLLEIDHDTDSTSAMDSESQVGDYSQVVVKLEDSNPQPESDYKLDSELILPDDGEQSNAPVFPFASTELDDEEAPRMPQSRSQVSEMSRPSSNLIRRRKKRPIANAALEKKIGDLKGKIKKLEAGASSRSVPPGSSLGQGNGMRYFLMSLLPEIETMSEEQMRAFKIKVMMLIDEMKSSSK